MNTNKERFKATLRSQYERLFKTPDYEFVAKLTTPEVLASKIVEGLITGAASKDGEGVKTTCKILNIPYTYKALKEFLIDPKTVAFAAS